MNALNRRLAQVERAMGGEGIPCAECDSGRAIARLRCEIIEAGEPTEQPPKPRCERCGRELDEALIEIVMPAEVQR